MFRKKHNRGRINILNSFWGTGRGKGKKTNKQKNHSLSHSFPKSEQLASFRIYTRKGFLNMLRPHRCLNFAFSLFFSASSSLSALLLCSVRSSVLFQMDREANPKPKQFIIRSFNDETGELLMKMLQTVEKIFKNSNIDTKSDNKDRWISSSVFFLTSCWCRVWVPESFKQPGVKVEVTGQSELVACVPVPCFTQSSSSYLCYINWVQGKMMAAKMFENPHVNIFFLWNGLAFFSVLVHLNIHLFLGSFLFRNSFLQPMWVNCEKGTWWLVNRQPVSPGPLGTRLPGFQSQPHLLLVVWPWGSYLTSQCSTVPVYKKSMSIVPTS